MVDLWDKCFGKGLKSHDKKGGVTFGLVKLP